MRHTHSQRSTHDTAVDPVATAVAAPSPAVRPHVPLLETIRSVLSLIASYGLLLMANAMFGTLLGVRTTIEGWRTEVVGMIMAAYFVGLLVGALHAGRGVSAVGHIRAFATFASVMSITALVHVLVVDPVAWALMRFVSGFCMAGMIMVTESWLNVRATNENRGQVIAVYMITNYAAASVGQLLIQVADPGEFELFTIASIIFSLALVPVLMTRSHAPTPEPRERLRPRELWRTSPLGFSAALSSGLVNSVFFSLGPVFAQGIGLSVAATAKFMAVGVFGGLLFQWPVGRLSDRFDRRWVIAGVALASAAAAVVILLTARQHAAAFVVAVAIYGGLSFTVYSQASAHTNDFSDPAKRVQTASALLLAYGVGACIGPIVAATLMGRLGPQAMFGYIAVIQGFLGFFSIYRRRRRGAPPAHTSVINLPGGQFTSGQLQMTLRDGMDRDLAQMSGGRPGRAFDDGPGRPG